MLDEQLIHEVQNHAVIYNRQKYFINSSDPKKYLSKEDAWQEIAIKLNSDVETCKKRWKYLRERYVQQRKQGDPPNYEHLSRPYLDKMKFLDKHIQPRKSYKQVSSFLSSPNANGSFTEFMDSSRSNGSLGNTGYHNSYHDSNYIKEEPQVSFPNFTTDLSSSRQHHSNVHHQQKQHQQQQQQQHQQQQSAREFISSSTANDTSTKRQNNTTAINNGHTNNVNNGSSSSANNYHNGDICHVTPCPSSSSLSLKSVKSPLSSPQEHINETSSSVTTAAAAVAAAAAAAAAVTNSSITEAVTGLGDLKRPRIDIKTIINHHNDSKNESSDNDDNDDDDDDGDGDDDDEQQDDEFKRNHNNLLPNLSNNFANLNGRFSNHHSDLLALFQQQFTQHHQQRQQQQQQQQQQQPLTSLTPIHQQQQSSLSSLSSSNNSSIKCSEQLLGELVTSELLKMTKERQRIVQRKILEILFFDD